MQRRRFSREFKVEAVKLRERGVSAAQAARDLDLHENVLRKWVKEFDSDPVQAFPGHGQMKPRHCHDASRRRQFAGEFRSPRVQRRGAVSRDAGECAAQGGHGWRGEQERVGRTLRNSASVERSDP